MNQTEQPTHFEQEPVLVPSPCEYPRKHCKEIDLVGKGSNLFVIVSAHDEKRFGLEIVQEICVPSSVLNKMVPSFEILTPKRFLNQMSVLLDDCCEFRPSLKVSIGSNMFDILGTKKEPALDNTFAELNPLLKNMFCEFNLFHEVCKPTIESHDFEFSTSSIMHLFCPMSVQKETKAKEKYKYLGEKTIKDKPPDAILLLGSNYPAFRRRKRVHESEDHRRFKPPDLNQNKHQNIGLSIQIKEEPPDPTSKPMTRLHISGGKSLILSTFMSTNLLYVHADYSDLRSNLSQERGDDVRMDSIDALEHETKDNQEEEELVAEDALIVPAGPMTRSRTKMFNQAIGGLLNQIKIQDQTRQGTLMLIQAN